jgi:large subunit ribosomal protein L7Ae
MPKKIAKDTSKVKESSEKPKDSNASKSRQFKIKKGLIGKPLKEIKKLPVFEKRGRNFGIGNDIQPKRDLTHFVKWPRYVRLQRQKRILLQRLKVPPTLNQFQKTVDKATALSLFKLLNKYRPETKQAKKARLNTIAEAKAKNQTVDIKKPLSVTYGFNAVVSAIESKKAKLVVIAHDVDPIELVIYIPTLCRKLNIPYCIIKGKSRLGTLVHMRTTSVIAVTDVNKEDKTELVNLAGVFNETFNKNADLRKQWGGGRLPTHFGPWQDGSCQ